MPGTSGANLRHYRGTGALVYVTDLQHTDSARFLSRDVAAHLVQIDELSNEHLGTDPNLIFDVDLRAVDTVRHLKQLLVNCKAGCRIFLVDGAARVTTVHAKVLGANSVLPRPTTSNQIAAAIRKHFGSVAVDGPQAIAKLSIDEGMRVLDHGFQSLVDDTVFDTVETTKASGRIADAISELGAKPWLDAVKGYHEGTFQHCMLVTGVVSAFAVGLGMARADVVKLTLAGMLHDIGKAAIPLDILDKPGSLTAAEMDVLRQHPVIGHTYLSGRSGIPAGILRNVRHHHELLDGSGYPDRLAGSEIDDITRIVTIADIYAALIERRSYKEPKTPEQALGILSTMVSAGKLEHSLVREFARIMLAEKVA